MFNCRIDDVFKKAIFYFKNYAVDSFTSVENVYEMFANVHVLYNQHLRKSLDNLVKSGNLKDLGNPTFYNYLILDARKLYNILDRYNTKDLVPVKIHDADAIEFKNSCEYAGKGKDGRKLEHAVITKKIIEGHMGMDKLNCRYKTIKKLWKEKSGVVILHLFTETSHYEAHCREYAIIKALNLDKLTNIVNGSAYGIMKDTWNNKEVINYGNMILYNALKMCIQEPPTIIYENDVLLPKKRISRKNSLM